MPWLSQHMLVDHMRPHIYFLSDIGRSLPPPTAKSQERAFVVPFRNMVFLSMAVSLAASVEADVVSGAFNYVKGGEAALDKSEEFLASLEVAARNATEPHWKRVRIHNSFQGLLKRAIIKRGLALGVDFSLSWSCYNAYKYPCGQCGPCHRRRTIFKELGVDEGVRYHTKEYVWSKVDHYVASVT